MTCLGCQSTGFIEVIGRGDEVVGFTACPRCSPRDAALVEACRRLRELEAEMAKEAAA